MKTNLSIRGFKKRIIAIVVMGILVFNSGIGINYAAQGEEEVDTLTLDKALELALENNLDIKKAQADKIRSTVSRSQQKKLAGDSDDPSTGMYDIELQKKLAEVSAKHLSDLTEQTYITAEMQVELSVKTVFSELLYTNEVYKLAKMSRDQSEESLKFVQKKYELGQVSNNQVLSAEADLASKEADLINAEIAYKSSIMNMNQLLNEDLNKEWSLDSSFNEKIIELPDLETLREHMNENHPVILGSNMNYDIAKTTFDLAKGFYPDNVWTYKYAEQDYNKAMYDHENTLMTQEKTLQQSYMGVEGSLKAMEMLQKSADSMAESYRISLLRYELGMMTLHDLNNVMISYQAMENNLLNAKLNYKLAIAQLEFVSAYELNK